MPVPLHGVIPSQLQHFAFAFVELPDIPVHPFFRVYVLNSSLALQCSNCPQSGGVTTVVLYCTCRKLRFSSNLVVQGKDRKSDLWVLKTRCVWTKKKLLIMSLVKNVQTVFEWWQSTKEYLVAKVSAKQDEKKAKKILLRSVRVFLHSFSPTQGSYVPYIPD